MPLKSECSNQQKIILPRQFTQNISYRIKQIGNLQTQEGPSTEHNICEYVLIEKKLV